MNRNIVSLIAVMSALLVGTLRAGSIAAQEESFAIDPNTGDYHIRYKSVYDGNLIEVIFVPATKIIPTVKSRFQPTKEGKIDYSYRLKNSNQSRQNIVTFLVLSVSRIDADVPLSPHGIIKLIAPTGWEGSVLSDNVSDRSNKNLNVGWNWDYRNPEKTEDGIRPGESQGEFAIRSMDLPGVTIVRLAGGTPIQGFPDPGPNPDSPVGKQFNELHSRDFVVRYAAAPRIAVPTPFDTAVVLTGIQQHVKTDMLSMQLIDTSLIALLDPWFASAIDAAKRNNTEGMRHAIKELRRLLKQEHADVDRDDDGDMGDDDKEKKTKPRIDKLAARVLDFDLKYVEKRVKSPND